MPAIIYQMKANPENHGKLFQGIKTITGNINLNDYEKVAVLLDDEINGDSINSKLENIFAYGNSEDYHKANSQSRSISVSDIIKLDGKYYYVDSFGFEDVTDRIEKNKPVEGNYDINDLADEIEKQTGVQMNILEVYQDFGAGIKHMNICPEGDNVQLLSPAITNALANGGISKETFDEEVKKAVEYVNKHNTKKQESLDEDVKLINPEDKEYYDRLFKVYIPNGTNVGGVVYKVYANYEQQALEIAVAYAEKEAPGILFDIMDIDEDETQDYLYIDGTMEGAEEPHYINVMANVQDITNLKECKLLESFEEESEEAKDSLKDQLVMLGMTEDQADSTITAIMNIIQDKLNPITESLEDYQDKLSISYMAKIFTQMRKNGWDGKVETAEKYFDDIMKQLDPNFKEKEEPVRESKVENIKLQEEDNHTVQGDEAPLEDNEELDDNKTIVDYIEDRIGQVISVGEFNTIMQSIFGKFNEIFLQTSEIYNMDPSEPQEVTIWDDEDAYVITYNIVDEMEPTIEITDVNIL